MVNSLPKGWCSEKLSTIAERITKGATPTSYGYKYQTSGIRFIKIENIKGGKVNHSSIRDFISIEANNNQRRSMLEDGDILFSIAGTIGVGCIIQKQDLPANTNQALSIIRGTKGFFVSGFLLNQLSSCFSQDQINRKSRGGGMNNISLRDVGEVVLSIPPLNEQRRIVAKLEKLLAKVDACRERLEKIPAILKRFRQSVLAAACSGRLTAGWRENDQKRKDAFTLLELNVLEREKKFKNECEIALNTGNGPPRPYPVNLEPIDYDELDSLPDTWKWERLINIAHVVGGVTKGRKLKSEQVITLPYLRVANVQDGYIDFSEIKEIEALREDLQKYRLRKGDILFTEGGDRDKLGRGTVWDGSIENCIHQNHIFRARLYCSKILPEFISLATKSDHSKRYFFNNASQTVNLASINKITLGNLPIAIPPDDEQHEIVCRVEALFKIADDIEKRYQKAKTHVDKLTQSILAKAFRGELVPQDPNDEPATELLKRIQAERKNQEAETRPGRKSTRRRVKN